MSFRFSILTVLAAVLFLQQAFAAAEADLLAGYDQTYASANGGAAQTRVIIANAIAGSNAINERSGTPQRVRIVGYYQAAQYSYQRTSNGGFVGWMANYDSRLADVTNAGDALGADLVTFICESTNDGAAAVAQQPGRFSAFDPSAFWSTVVAHELGGHNFGCSHEDGHANPKTVMLHNYCGGGAQGWYSNPNVWLNGTRLLGGDSCLGAGPNGGDNAKVISNAAQGVADRMTRVSTAPNLGNVVRRWQFNQAAGNAPAGTTVTDPVTGTALATVQGTGATFTGGGLRLPGGTAASGAAYLQLPAGLISGYTNVTIEIWATPLSAQNWGRIMDFNNGTSNYVTLSSAVGTNLDQQRFESITGGATVTRNSSLPTVEGVPHHYAITFASTGAATGRWTWFRDGDEVAYLDVAYALASFQDVNNWLGRSAYAADARANCEYAELRVSNVAMSRSEILANYSLGPNHQVAAATLTDNDTTGSTSFNTAGRWSDGLAPSAGKSYETYNFRLRTPADATSRTFGGQSLTLTGGGLSWKGTGSNTITINSLNLRGESEVLNAGSGTFTLAGTMAVETEDAMVRPANGAINLTANLSGNGSLLFVDDTTTLAGSNGAFTGRITVGDGRPSVLAIDSEARLGPNPSSLVPNQLSFNRGTLQTAGTFSLDDPNRGILFDVNGGTFNVASGALTVACPLSSPDNGGNPIVGTLRKNGAGTLVLASTSSTFNGSLHVDGGGTGNDGVVRVANNQVLANAHNPIFIENNNAGSSTLQLDGASGAITLTRVQLSGRSGSTPAIQNLTGNNNVGGLTIMSGGANHIVQSDGGLLNFSGSIYSGVTGDRTLTFQGNGDITTSNTVSELSATTLSVVKQGTGTLSLNGACTHDGGTLLNGGTLRLNGSLTTTGTMTTAVGTVFSGTGTSNAATTVNGTHSPGNSTNNTGTQTLTGAVTYGATAKLGWTLASNSTAAGTSGKVAAQAVTVTSGAKVNLVFNGPGSAVDFNNSFWLQTRTWTVLTSTAMSGQFSLGTVSNDSLGNPVASRGSFLLQQSATGVTVTFHPSAATPPPASNGLTAAGWPGYVVLGWEPAATATSYNVRRSTNPGGPYELVASGLSDTTFADITTTNGTSYYYVVTAVNANGEGDESAEITGVPHLPATIDKAENTTNLYQPASWAGGVLPNSFDTARWSGLSGANSVALGANMSLNGIRIGTTGGAVSISSGNTLTLGSNGIDMSAASQNLGIASGLTLGAGHQIWDVATGRTFSLTGAFARSSGSTLLIDRNVRTGTVTASGLTNANGIIGPWALVKNSGSSANNSTGGHTFAANDGSGNLAPYTGATAQTATTAWGGIASGGDGTANYDISSSTATLGATGLNRNLNTLRYTGSGARQPGNNGGDLLTLNGFMNAGTGAFTFGRNGANITNDFSFGILIGASNELVISPMSADLMFYSWIKDGAGGAGKVTIVGNNTTTFSGANSFTGGLNLNSGTLQLGNDSALGTGPLQINGGAIRATGAVRTFSNNVTLGGDFTLGRGTNFSGPASLLRRVTITSSNSDSLAATTSTFSGVISGACGLAFNEGANPIGTIVLTGANTYSGGTTLNGGTLQIGSASALGVATGDLAVNGGTLNLNAYSPVIRMLSGTGGIIANLAAGTATLTTNSTQDTNFAGSMQNGTTGQILALAKQGTGTLTLSGACTHTGATSVQGGALVVNGSLGNTAVTVASSATLGGSGSLGGATTILGTHSPGTQAFGSSLSYGSSSAMKWELNSNSTSAGTFDTVTASGAVTISSGATFDASFNSSGSAVVFNDDFWTQSRSWVVLTGSAVSGTFALGSIGNDSAGRALADYGTLSLQQNATSITLVFTPNLSPVETWRQANFGTTSNTGNAADTSDPDNDGLNNLLEYALGSNPNGNAASAAPQVSTTTGKLSISFTRNTAASDLTLSVIAADTLTGPWSEIARSSNGAAFTAIAPGALVNETGAGTVKNVESTDIVLITDPAHPKRFMRLEVKR